MKLDHRSIYLAMVWRTVRSETNVESRTARDTVINNENPLIIPGKNGNRNKRIDPKATAQVEQDLDSNWK